MVALEHPERWRRIGTGIGTGSRGTQRGSEVPCITDKSRKPEETGHDGTLREPKGSQRAAFKTGAHLLLTAGAFAQCASGSGRSWKCTARGRLPFPPSISHGVRSPLVVHNPRPFQPALASSIRPSNPLA